MGINFFLVGKGQSNDVENRLPATERVFFFSLLEGGNLELGTKGRYWFADEGIELIDYKSAKEVHLPDVEAIDEQIGVYYLALDCPIAAMGEAHTPHIPN